MLTLNSIAGARECLKSTLEYVKNRVVFGKPLIEFELTKDKLSNYSARLIAARSYAHNCVKLINSKKYCRKEASLAKLNACELAIEIANGCLQLHGGYGYTTEFRPERWLRDLRLNTIGGGTSEIMARIAAKEIF